MFCGFVYGGWAYGFLGFCGFRRNHVVRELVLWIWVVWCCSGTCLFCGWVVGFDLFWVGGCASVWGFGIFRFWWVSWAFRLGCVQYSFVGVVLVWVYVWVVLLEFAGCVVLAVVCAC